MMAKSPQTVSPRRQARSVQGDVVVPIYNARADVERCLRSLLACVRDGWRIVLVDDASTDGDLKRFLDETAAADPRVVLLRNEVNAGFVLTANRGMRHARGRDVVLLNSDTVVTVGFIDRLVECVYGDDRTGIATPFTNNGTICSIPEFCRDNELPVGVTLDEFAELVNEISLGRRPELVTGVGFCMYVRAEVFERIGYFDEEHFGRGFGEENDFCERAKAAGYAIRLCDDVFILHTGKASFGDEGRELERVNSKVMDRLHPRYFADVAEFCARNPLAELHANVRFHLARRAGRRYPAMLFLLHAGVLAESRGGTEHLVRDLVENLDLPRALVVFPEDRHIVAVEVFDGEFAKALVYRIPTGAGHSYFAHRQPAVEAALGRIVDTFGVGAAHIHHLLTWPLSAWRVLHERGIPFCYTIHDYYCVCPSWNLLNRRTGLPCGCSADAPAEVEACVKEQFAALNMASPSDPQAFVARQREEFGQLLDHAIAVIAPSEAAYQLVRRFHPTLPEKGRVIGHGYAAPAAIATIAAASPQYRPGAPLRVALLGQIAYPAKGAAAYLSLLEMARGLPIEWHLFGDVEVYGFRRKLEGLGLGSRLRLHGPYRREDIVGLLIAEAIDLAMILPTCHETFCFTLSESLLAGVPAIVSNVGALPERVVQSGAGVVAVSDRAGLDILRRLIDCADELRALKSQAAGFRHSTPRENADAHRQAYGDLWRIVTTPGASPSITDADRALFRIHYDTQQRAAAIAAARPLSYQASWWYPYYLRMRPLIPPRWRGLARRLYTRSRSIGGPASP